MTPLELALQSSRARETRARLALAAARAELEAATRARCELEDRARRAELTGPGWRTGAELEELRRMESGR